MTTGAIDPHAPIDFVEFALTMHRIAIQLWAEGKSDPGDDVGDAQSADDDLLDVISRYLRDPRIEDLRTGWHDGQPDATAVVARLRDLSYPVLPAVVGRYDGLFHAGEHRLLIREARFGAELASALGDESAALTSYIAAARAARRVADNDTVTELYTRAIKLGEHCRPLPAALLALCHDNLGVALHEVGKDDEALPHFERALRLEPDLDGRLEINNNLANALTSLGYYRRAASLHAENHAVLEQHGIRGRRRAVALDNWAQALAALGDTAEAASLLDRAAVELAGADLESRLINAQSRAEIRLTLRDHQAAGQAFAEALDLAFQLARRSVDVEHFRRSYRNALAKRVPRDSDAWAHFGEGLRRKQRAEWDLAVRHFDAAARIAGNAGDDLLGLRALANIAATLSDARRIDEARQVCANVRTLAADRGLITPLFMVVGTLTALIQAGAEVGDLRGALGLAAQTVVLQEVNDEIIDSAQLADNDPERLLRLPRHVPYAKLATAAERYHADDLAALHYRTALTAARADRNRFGELNTMVGLMNVVVRQGAEAEAELLVRDLTGAVDEPDLSPTLRVVIHRALAARLRGRDSATALAHARRAAAQLEELRAAQPAGARRADLDREYGIHPFLVRLLQESGASAGDVWEALQHQRARRLLEALNAAQDGGAPYQPPDRAEAQALLARIPARTALVDVVVFPDALVAFVLDAAGLRTVRTAGDPGPLAAGLWGDTTLRAADAVRLAGHPLLVALAAGVEDVLAPGYAVLLVVDDELANIPLHAAPLQDGFWCDKRVLSRLPAVGVLRYTAPHRSWTGRVLVAGDSSGDLPWAARECAEIATAFGVDGLVGQACTADAVRSRLIGEELDVVHLAVHGRGDVRRGGRASLLLANGEGGTEWISFDDIVALPWRADLIVFSGCSTAVGGPRNGAGLYGVAQAAAEAGATSVVASLWPVDDRSAALFMIAFYRMLAARLQVEAVIDLREVVDHARGEVRRAQRPEGSGRRRDGRDLILAGAYAGQESDVDAGVAAMLQWAPFVLLGDPLLVARPGCDRQDP